MAVTASWLQYNNIPPFGKKFDYIPFLPFDLTNYLQVFGLKFQASEIDYVEILLQDEFADVFFTDGTTLYRENLISNDDIEIDIARFWVYPVRLNSTNDVGTGFGGVTYDNGPDNDGVGATLTAVNNGKFTHNSVTDFVVGEKILVKNQTSTFQNGIYEISILGNDNTKWVLTRVSEANTGLKLKDVIVTNSLTSSSALKIDQSTPAVNGSSAITFNTVVNSIASLESNLSWTSLLARSTDMARFILNKTPEDPPIAADNRSLSLNRNFESFSYLFAIRVTKNGGSSIADFQIRNLKLIAQFKTKLPTTAPRPVKIFAEEGFPVIRETMKIEYYLPTTTSDNVTYNVTDKRWDVTDKAEVFRQPAGGVRNVVSPQEFLVSGATGNITFLQSQNPTSIITVTISKPLTEQGI